MSLRVAFVPGVTPDKWARTWRERSREPLELTLVDEADQRRVLDAGQADLCFVRLPVDREGLHLIPLYVEQPVVVVSREHPVAAYDEIPLADLLDEQFVLGPPAGFEPRAEQLAWPPMLVRDAFEVVASGSGVVVVPLSVARLHHRKDVVHRPVDGVPGTQVGLAWPVAADDERIQTFIGIVRGRSATSSRGTQPEPVRKRRRR